MIKLKNIVEDIKSDNSTYEFGCVMLDFDFPIQKQIHKIISPFHVYDEFDTHRDVLEKDTHVTLLYGLHNEVLPMDVYNIVSKYKFDKITLDKISLFENEKFDVLKYDVSGDILHVVNKELKTLPHTSTFPDYKPHSTIAYLKPGKGKYYVQLLSMYSAILDGIEVVPSIITYSLPNGENVKININ